MTTLKEIRASLANLGTAAKVLFVLVTLLLLAGVAWAQGPGYTLDWWTVDGGGGTLTGGDYTLGGTIGQPDAGTMSGGDYTLGGGIWGGGAAPIEKPDLVITEIKCDRANDRIGYVVKNVGGATAPKSHDATLWVDGEEVCHDHVGVDLAPGASHTGWFDCYTWPECTDIRVKVCADNYDEVDESDETNNCKEETCICPEKPDLVITEIKCDRANDRIGYVVKNVGGATAPKSHDATLWVDGEEVCHDHVDVDLAPGDSHTGWFGCYTWPECTDIRVKICADNNDEVDESNETNNCKEETCSCNQVYLEPQDSSVSYCNTTEVEIRVNASNFQGGQIKLTYDSTCADVTNWERNRDDFSYGTWESDTPGEEWITFSAEGLLTGEYLIGTLTIHCESEEECTTDLDFVAPSVLKDNLGDEVPATWTDGTFECTVGMCGDVAPSAECDGVVDVGDFILLLNYVGYPGEYSLCCEGCGDVAPSAECDGVIDVGDFILLLNYVGYPGEYSLCCEAAPSTTVAPAVPTAAEDEVKFVPQESSAPFCETTEVEIWVDATDFQGGQMKFTYDSTCADVTNWERNTDDFPYGTWESGTPGEEWILFSAEELLTGEYLIGTLTIHCVSEEECTTPLDFVAPSVLKDNLGNEVPATWTDGTFRRGLHKVYLPLIMKNYSQ